MLKIIFLTFLCLIGFYSVIYAQKNSFCAKRSANVFLLGNNKTKETAWILAQTYDPYNGGITTPADEKYPDHLFFQKNGKMKHHTVDFQQDGTWKLNKSKTDLLIEYPKKDAKSEAYTFNIKELTKEKMVLAIKGRHGMVERTYVPFKNKE